MHRANPSPSVMIITTSHSFARALNSPASNLSSPRLPKIQSIHWKRERCIWRKRRYAFRRIYQKNAFCHDLLNPATFAVTHINWTVGRSILCHMLKYENYLKFKLTNTRNFRFIRKPISIVGAIRPFCLPYKAASGIRRI